ncbi:hypothetical protein [Microbulbifer halophilus]|uniref:hypothetical protein n=1 Tax=Microbulbifer halophilus TaxID=453963 RepID=UPI00360F0C8D
MNDEAMKETELKTAQISFATCCWRPYPSMLPPSCPTAHGRNRRGGGIEFFRVKSDRLKDPGRIAMPHGLHHIAIAN